MGSNKEKSINGRKLTGEKTLNLGKIYCCFIKFKQSLFLLIKKKL